jgi:ribosomal protein L29
MVVQELENKIRDLQKELAEVQMEQAALRLQPCKGDSEILAKDVKYDVLNGT